MKDKLKIILPAGLVALALICVVMVRQGGPSQEDLGAQQSMAPAEETPNKPQVEEVTYTLPPIPSSVPVYTQKPTPEPDSSPTGETVTKEPDGTIVITPDFEAQESQAVKIVKPGSQVETNIGGGGGNLELGGDGVFHGAAPTPAPATPSPAPTAAPVTTAPPRVETPAPEATPAPTPAQQPQGGPPSYNGKYDGEISPDGQYMWIGGLGWLKQGVSDGGIGGQIDDSDYGWAPGEMGETVGTM